MKTYAALDDQSGDETFRNHSKTAAVTNPSDATQYAVSLYRRRFPKPSRAIKARADPIRIGSALVIVALPKKWGVAKVGAQQIKMARATEQRTKSEVAVFINLDGESRSTTIGQSM